MFLKFSWPKPLYWITASVFQLFLCLSILYSGLQTILRLVLHLSFLLYLIYFIIRSSSSFYPISKQ
jgi:hypothetical protein